MDKKIILVILVTVAVFMSAPAFAGIGLDSYYDPDSVFNVWSSLIMAGVFAAVAVTAVIVTGGTASPIVLGIGSWVGSLMGLSGAAAESAGLALLGGGSLASGGFGVLGGSVVLASALSFSGNVAFDYAYATAMDTYNYSQFKDASQSMTNLPLPQNSSGSDFYERAVNNLSGIQIADGKTYTQYEKFNFVRKILAVKHATIGLDDKGYGLLSLMYFASGQYKKAGVITNKYINSDREENSVVLFIHATSELYGDNLDFDQSVSDFNKVVSDTDPTYRPLLYSVYLDRALYRVQQGNRPFRVIDPVYKQAFKYPIDKNTAALYVMLNARALVHIKLQQQKILSLYQNKDLWLSDGMYDVLAASLHDYIYTVTQLEHYNEQLLAAVNAAIDSRHISWGSGWQDELAERLQKTIALLEKYDSGYEQLRLDIKEIYNYRQCKSGLFSRWFCT